MMPRDAARLFVMLGFLTAGPVAGQEAALTPASIAAVREALAPAAEFLAAADDVDERSPLWRRLGIDGTEASNRELREFFRSFAGEPGSAGFANSQGGLYAIRKRYLEDPSLAVFGSPSASYVLANRNFGQPAERTAPALADATRAWAVANREVVEHNVRELLGGVAPILSANPRTGKERVEAALAERAGALAIVNRETVACAAKYGEVAAEFERGLYRWDDSDAGALGAVVNPALVQALAASRARLGTSAADRERARRIDAAIGRVRASGVRFERTTSTGGNEPGPGVATNASDDAGAPDAGLQQGLARTAYLYQAVWGDELASRLGVGSQDLRAARGPIHRASVDLAQRIVTFEKRFRERVEFDPSTPRLEIRKLVWEEGEQPAGGAAYSTFGSLEASIGGGVPFLIRTRTDPAKGLVVDSQFRFESELGQAIVRYSGELGTRRSTLDIGLFALQDSVPVQENLPVPDAETLRAYRERLEQREEAAPILSPLLLLGDLAPRDPGPGGNEALDPIVQFASAERPVPGRNLRITGVFRGGSQVQVLFRARDGSREIAVEVASDKHSLNSVVVQIPEIQGKVDLVVVEDGRSSRPYSYDGEILPPDSRPDALRRVSEKQGRQILEFITQFAPIRTLGGILYTHARKTGFFRYVVASKEGEGGRWVFVYDLVLKDRYKDFTLDIYLAFLPEGAQSRFVAGDASVLEDFIVIARIERSPALGRKVYRATVLENVIAKGIGIDYDERTKKIVLNNLGRIDLKKFGAVLGWDSDREVLFHEQDLGDSVKLKGEASGDGVTLSLTVKDERVVDGFRYVSKTSVEASDPEAEEREEEQEGEVLTSFSGTIYREGSDEKLAELALVQSGPAGQEPGRPSETIGVRARIPLGSPGARRGSLSLDFASKEDGSSKGVIGWSYAEGDLRLRTSLRYAKLEDNPLADYQLGGGLTLALNDILADVDIEASGRIDAELLRGDLTALSGRIDLEADFDFAVDAKLEAGLGFQRDFVRSDETVYTFRVRATADTPLAEIFLQASTTLGGEDEEDLRFSMGVELEGVVKSAFRLARQEKEYRFPIP